MDPITMGLMFGAGGALKSLLVDKPREEKERALAAETQRYSPWTKLQAQPVKAADPFGSALQFGATGASLGSNIESAAAQKKLNEALTNRLNGGGSITGSGPVFDPQEEPSGYDEMVHSVPLRISPWAKVSTFR